MSKFSPAASFDVSEAESLPREVLQAIDMKVIKYVRALAAGDERTAETILSVAKTAEPVAQFGEAGARFLVRALGDARACFELLGAPVPATV